MKKKFIAKKRKKTYYKLFFFFFFINLGLIISYKQIEASKIKIDNKLLVKTILSHSNHHQKTSIIKKIINKSPLIKPTSLINNNYKKLVTNNNDRKSPKEIENKKPIIYIYNSHQTEEYMPNNYVEYSIKPTVQMADYIVEDILNKNNFKTLVEENKIKTILDIHKWNYINSYKASRILMENAKNSNPSLKYFIDIHRDSLSKEKTTISINNKNYARIVFIVGLENNNYQKNLDFTTKINNIINSKYPSLSKGIYKKEGEGVNGIYNQDFSPYTILIEIGGKDNTVEEVLNTSVAFTECFMEAISNNES